MNNEIFQILSFGKALAQVLAEKAQFTATDVISELEKIKAEYRENWRELIVEVQDRVNQDKQGTSSPNQIIIDEPQVDTQTLLDELRAEIASLKAELKNHRNNS
jgi:polyhydroxyalkanoate synthesis regulator phasin